VVLLLFIELLGLLLILMLLSVVVVVSFVIFIVLLLSRCIWFGVSCRWCRLWWWVVLSVSVDLLMMVWVRVGESGLWCSCLVSEGVGSYLLIMKVVLLFWFMLSICISCVFLMVVVCCVVLSIVLVCGCVELMVCRCICCLRMLLCVSYDDVSVVLLRCLCSIYWLLRMFFGFILFSVGFFLVCVCGMGGFLVVLLLL